MYPTHSESTFSLSPSLKTCHICILDLRYSISCLSVTFGERKKADLMREADQDLEWGSIA